MIDLRIRILARSGAPGIGDHLEERIAADHGLARRKDVVPVEQLTEEWKR